jgi:putative copper resistance protein D
VTLAFTGHPADDHGWLGILHGANQSLHLIAAAAWVGALPALWICAGHWREPTLQGDVERMLRRFSLSGHVAVVLVIVTGLVETQLIVGHVPTDLSSSYQLLLDLKVASVAAMIVFAILNRYRAVPRLEAGDVAGLRPLIRGTIAEIALAAVVVALVSLFGTLDPG